MSSMIDIMSCVVDIWTVIDMRGDPHWRFGKQCLPYLGHVLTGPAQARDGWQQGVRAPRGRQVPVSLHCSRVWVAFASGPGLWVRFADAPRAAIGPTASDESGRLVFQCTMIRSPVSGGIVAATSAATGVVQLFRSRN